jgi:hypothetical protein
MRVNSITFKSKREAMKYNNVSWDAVKRLLRVFDYTFEQAVNRAIVEKKARTAKRLESIKYEQKGCIDFYLYKFQA